MEKRVWLDVLMGVYGPLLTQRQQDAMRMYADEDLSLGEIAQEEGITRQGVRDAVKRAERTLMDIEDKLHIAQRLQSMVAGLETVADELQADNPQQAARIRELIAEWEGE